eukprot:CAMPEP_0115246190 /NCGR_PEP_ID=MMETSP0270-20121206/40896_1 /TAXON_ID=71861 /ORGANISM="Scrippsiella trochoidea, Strain CCMP3099" /LENGTH=59 /DNA_ID=CAMNT_0002661391 /DNA_START=85 /DNA_END=261 /DNA_ORIENTATION=+
MGSTAGMAMGSMGIAGAGAAPPLRSMPSIGEAGLAAAASPVKAIRSSPSIAARFACPPF